MDAAHIKGIKKAAKLVRKYGQREDTILAHINKSEAALLKRNFGGDINPYTGLPQYGKLGKFFKKAAPYVAGALGNMVGGPAGGAAAAALVGASQRGKGNKLEGAMTGGLKGLAASSIASSLGDLMGSQSGSLSHNLFGMKHASLLNKLGMSSAPSSGGGLGLSSIFGNMFGGAGGDGQSGGGVGSMGGMGGGGGGSGGGLSGLLGGAGGGMGGLPGLAILGSLFAKKKNPKKSEIEQAMRPQWQPEDQYRKPKPLNRRRTVVPENFDDTSEKAYFDEVNPETEYYAHGGYVRGGDVEGSDGGQDDTVPTPIRPKSFVLDATTTSMWGDGNTEAGKEKARKMKESLLKMGIVKEGGLEGYVKAMVSPGEVIIEKPFVDAIGTLFKGGNKKGIEVISKFRTNLRKQKGLTKFLPPKSKSFESYVR